MRASGGCQTHDDGTKTARTRVGCGNVAKYRAGRERQRYILKEERRNVRRREKFWIVPLSLCESFEVEWRAVVQSVEFNAGQGICDRVTCSLDMTDVGGEL